MPNDMVAKWLAYLGRTALDTAGVREPENEDDKAYWRITFGLASIVTAVIVMIVIIAGVGLLSGVSLTTPTTTDDTASAVFRGAAYTLVSILLLLLLAVLAARGVGALYSLSHNHPKLYGSVALVLLGGGGWALYRLGSTGSGAELLVLAAFIPGIPLMCPDPLKSQDVTTSKKQTRRA